MVLKFGCSVIANSFFISTNLLDYLLIIKEGIKLKKILFVTLLGAISTASFAQSGSYQSHSSYGTGSNSNSSTVSGYTRSNGTHVDSYHRTAPNSTQTDNYGTIGNTNPYTGQQGTHTPAY